MSENKTCLGYPNSCNNVIDYEWHNLCDECYEKFEELKEEFQNELHDNKAFRYGLYKRPLTPIERKESGLPKGSWVLTDKGNIKAKQLFKEMFPEWADYESHSGLIDMRDLEV